jgi:hypothetical protein
MRNDKPSKTRVKGGTVYHTPRGGVYHGDITERPRGLTTEQAESQRVGAKIDERYPRDDAHRRVEMPPHHLRTRKDELTTPPYGKKPPRKKQ